jgi:hypothetical protein
MPPRGCSRSGRRRVSSAPPPAGVPALATPDRGRRGQLVRATGLPGDCRRVGRGAGRLPHTAPSSTPTRCCHDAAGLRTRREIVGVASQAGGTARESSHGPRAPSALPAPARGDGVRRCSPVARASSCRPGSRLVQRRRSSSVGHRTGSSRLRGSTDNPPFSPRQAPS